MKDNSRLPEENHRLGALNDRKKRDLLLIWILINILAEFWVGQNFEVRNKDFKHKIWSMERPKLGQVFPVFGWGNFAEGAKMGLAITPQV